MEEEGANGSMEATGEEGKVQTMGRWWWSKEFRGYVAVIEVDFRQAYVFLGVEAFRGIGIA